MWIQGIIAATAVLIGLFLYGRWRSNVFVAAPDPIPKPEIDPTLGQEGLRHLFEVMQDCRTGYSELDLARAVADNEEVLDRAAEVLDHERVCLPLKLFTEDGPTSLAPQMQMVMHWSRLAVARGTLRLRRGEVRGGLADLLRVRRLSDGLYVGHDPNQYSLQAIYQQIADGALGDGLRPPPDEVDLQTDDPTVAWPTSGWTDDDCAAAREALDELLAWDAEPRALLAALAGRYHEERQHWVDDAKAVPPLAVPGDTLRLLRAQFVALLELAALPPHERDWSTVPEVPRSRFYNACGRSYLGEHCRTINDSLFHTADTRVVLTQLNVALLALKLYLEGHGRSPVDWDELIAAGVLVSPPLDPFTGRPLEYDPRAGRLVTHLPSWQFSGKVLGSAEPTVHPVAIPFVAPPPTAVERDPSAPRSDPQGD